MSFYKRLKIIALYSFLAIGFIGNQASATSLVEVFQAALKNDPQWQAEKASVASDIAQSKTGRAGLLPDISAQASWKQYEQSNDAFPDSAQYIGDSQSVQLRQPLFRLDKWNEYKASKKNAQASIHTLRVNKAELINRVSSVYFDILKAKLQKNVTTIAEKEAKLEFLAQEFKQRLGMVTVADVDRAQSNQYQARTNVILASNNELLQLDYLMQLTALPFVVMRPLVDIQVESFELDSLEQLTARLYQQNAQLASLRYRIQNAEYVTKRIRSLFVPQVDLVAQYGTSDSLQITQQGNSVVEGEQTSYGVELNWPLFQGGSKFAQLEAAKLQNEALDAQYLQLANNLERDLSGLWYQFQQSKTVLQSRLYSQSSAQKFLERTQLLLELGDASPIEEASAQAALQAEMQQVLIAKLDTISQWLSIKLLLAEVTLETIAFIDQQLVFDGQ